jgi:hypothetical protein
VRRKLVLSSLLGILSLASYAQQLPAPPDSVVAAAAAPRHPGRALALRIAIPSVLVGVGVLAHSPRFNQALYQAKLDMQAETQEAFGTLNTHGVDDYTRHVPLAIAYGLMATGHAVSGRPSASRLFTCWPTSSTKAW